MKRRAYIVGKLGQAAETLIATKARWWLRVRRRGGGAGSGSRLCLGHARLARLAKARGMKNFIAHPNPCPLSDRPDTAALKETSRGLITSILHSSHSIHNVGELHRRPPHLQIAYCAAHIRPRNHRTPRRPLDDAAPHYKRCLLRVGAHLRGRVDEGRRGDVILSVSVSV